MSASAARSSQSYGLLSVKRWLYPLLAHPKAKQTLKWIVYSALVINTGMYIDDDIRAFIGAIPPDASALDIVFEFSTTIDMIGWVALVFLFELETYALEDDSWTKGLERLVRGARLVCYVFIAIAAIGYTAEAMEKFEPQPTGYASMCDAADQGIYAQISENEFPLITSENCEAISEGAPYSTLANEVAIVSAPVVEELQFLGFINIDNAVIWILVVLLIELEVWLQSADRFGSRALTVARQVKSLFYLVLIGNAVIWFIWDYYLYTWDAFLWIFGFWAIELNLAEWEQDRLEELGQASG